MQALFIKVKKENFSGFFSLLKGFVMNTRVAFHLVAAAALGLSVQANAYQAEVNGSYQNMDNDVADVDTYQVGGEFYLNGVQSNAGPFVEAAFLDQATSFRGTYQDNDIVDGVIIGGRFIEPTSGMLFEADISTGDLEGFNLGVGLYLDSHSTIVANYIEQDDTTDGFGIKYKNLITQNNGTYVNLEGGAQFIESDFDQEYSTFSVAADYFFDKTMSLGFGVAVKAGDEDSTQYGFDGSLFLAQNVTLEASLSQEDFDGIDDDITSFMVGGKVRF